MTTETDPLDTFVVTLQYTLRDINMLINSMNRPYETPVMQWATLINDIHLQIGPQVKELNESKTTPKEGGNQ